MRILAVALLLVAGCAGAVDVPVERVTESEAMQRCRDYGLDEEAIDSLFAAMEQSRDGGTSRNLNLQAVDFACARDPIPPDCTSCISGVVEVVFAQP